MTRGENPPMIALKSGKPATGNKQANQMSNPIFSRRAFTLGAMASVGAVSACGNGIGGRGPQTIDARVDATINEMYRSFPNTQQLAAKANGMWEFLDDVERLERPDDLTEALGVYLDTWEDWPRTAEDHRAQPLGVLQALARRRNLFEHCL